MVEANDIAEDIANVTEFVETLKVLNVSTPDGELCRLATNDNPVVSALAYANPNMADVTFLKILEETRREVVSKVCADAVNDLKKMKVLVTHPDPSLRYHMVYDFFGDLNFLHEWALIETDKKVLNQIASIQTLKPETLKILAFNEYAYVRSEVACHLNTPPHLIQMLLSDVNPHVKLEALVHPTTPDATVLEYVKTQYDGYGFESIAYKEHMSDETYLCLIEKAKLVLNPNQSVNVIDALIGNSTIGLKVLQSMFDDVCVDYKLFETFTSHPNADAELLTKIFEYGSKRYTGRFSLDTALAMNQNTPAEVLTIIAEKCDLPTQILLTQNLNTPLELVEQMLEQSSSDNFKSSAAKRLWKTHPKCAGWPIEWAEEHYGIKIFLNEDDYV